MGYLIRNAGESDLDALEAMEKACFSIPWTRELLAVSLPDGNHELLVAEEDGEILGYLGLMSVLDEGYLSNVAVAEEHRRRGIASALIRELLRRAEEKGLSFVTLEVRESNLPAITLYAGFGFVPVGRRRAYYSAPTEDALLMTKTLK